MHIVGTYECKLDPKGRIKLPVAIKKQLQGVGVFVLKRSVFQPCLEMYSMEEWSLLMQKVNKLNRFKKKNNDFIRRFTAGVKKVEIDATDRMLVPKDLLGIASLEKDVVLSSAINMIEIWDKTHYEKAIDDAAIDFAELAEEVMGNDDQDVS